MDGYEPLYLAYREKEPIDPLVCELTDQIMENYQDGFFRDQALTYFHLFHQSLKQTQLKEKNG